MWAWLVFFFFLQWIFGFVVFFYPGGSGTLRGESLPWHVVLGVTVFVLAVGNASLGFLEKLTFLENSGLAKYGSEAFLVNFTAIVTILFGASVILSVLCEGQASGDHSYSAIWKNSSCRYTLLMRFYTSWNNSKAALSIIYIL